MANRDIIEQVPGMGISELWEMYITIYDDKHINDEEYYEVKQGFTIQFDIRAYIRYMKGEDGFIKVNPKVQQIWIGKRKYSRSQIDDELDKRKAFMRKKIIEVYSENNDTTESRT